MYYTNVQNISLFEPNCMHGHLDVCVCVWVCGGVEEGRGHTLYTHVQKMGLVNINLEDVLIIDVGVRSIFRLDWWPGILE